MNNDLEKELISKNIVNLKGYRTKDGKHIPIFVDINRLLYNPEIIRNIISIIGRQIKNNNFDKILVFDKVSLIIGLGLSLFYNIKIEKYHTTKKDYNGKYLFLFENNHKLNYKNLDKVDNKHTIVLFNCSKNVDNNSNLDIIFFPKKKNKKKCVVLNFKRFSEIVEAIEFFGSKLEIVKIFSSNILDFNRAKLCKLSTKYQFLIWEGSLFSNDVSIFFYQVTGKYDFQKWVHFIDIQTPCSDLRKYTKILKALGSKTRINLSNDLDITYYFKADYFQNNKFLDIFNDK